MSVVVPTFADVEAAAARIAPYAVRTPLLEDAELDARTGGRVFLKPEPLQRTGSFKFRGAVNAVLQIPPERRAGGVVAFSSGNHAQGVAAAGAAFGLPATIVMPKDAPEAKIAGTRRLGATVVFYDRLTDDREAIARAIVERTGATLIQPFDNAMVVAGQGTIGLEIAADAAARGVTLDAAIAPCGGGGLLTGIALGLSGTSPATLVIGGRAGGFRRHAAVAGRGRADGRPRGHLIYSRRPDGAGAGPYSLRACEKFCGQSRHGHGRRARKSRLLCLPALKIVVEPGGGAALAAVLAGKFDIKNKAIAVVLSGGNADIATVARCCRSITDP